MVLRIAREGSVFELCETAKVASAETVSLYDLNVYLRGNKLSRSTPETLDERNVSFSSWL